MMRGLAGLPCDCAIVEMPFKEPDDTEIDTLIQRVRETHALEKKP